MSDSLNNVIYVLEALDNYDDENIQSYASKLDDALMVLTLENVDKKIKVNNIDKIAKIASDLDEFGDEDLQKCASVLDELLLTIAAPKDARAQVKQQSEDELNRLREEYRAKKREQLYHDKTSKEFGQMWRKEKIQNAVDDQLKKYRPLEHSLSTRYCPDHPGVGVVRVGDNVYQCGLDHKMYNFETGYTKMNGDQVPGGSVDLQYPTWGMHDRGHTMFDSRQTILSRFSAEEIDHKIQKIAKEVNNDKLMELYKLLDAEGVAIHELKSYLQSALLSMGDSDIDYKKVMKQYDKIEQFDNQLKELMGSFIGAEDMAANDGMKEKDLGEANYSVNLEAGQFIVRIPSDMSNEAREEIIKKIQGHYGYIYPIIFKEE